MPSLQVFRHTNKQAPHAPGLGLQTWAFVGSARTVLVVSQGSVLRCRLAWVCLGKAGGTGEQDGASSGGKRGRFLMLC